MYIGTYIHKMCNVVIVPPALPMLYRPVYGLFRAVLKAPTSLDGIPDCVTSFDIAVYNQGTYVHIYIHTYVCACMYIYIRILTHVHGISLSEIYMYLYSIY